jgi:transcriptional regulator with XRE-family HTH domain
MPYFFGAKLRHLRQQQGMAQAEIARQLSVTRFHINNLELDRDVPSLELILGISALFQVATDYLLRDAVPVDNVDTSERPISTSTYSAPTLFGAKLRHLRKTQSMTQATLVHRLGMRSQSHISLLESGRNQPSIELVLQLADLFSVTTDYLLRDDIPVEPPAAPEQ